MEENFSRVKISDIARQAGVSPGTVDRVIHNRGEVAAKTREKVLAIIREMNYQPDILASTLASKKTWRIAAVIPRADAANPFWKSPAEGIQQAWTEIRHYGVELEKHFFSYHDRRSFSQKLELVIQSQPSGVVIAPVFNAETNRYMNILNEMNIPVVFLNAQPQNTGHLAFVGQDPLQSGKVAAQLIDYCVSDHASVFIVNIISDKGGNNHILTREQGFREYFDLKKHNRKLQTINITSDSAEELHKAMAPINEIPLHKECGRAIFVTNSKVFRVAEFLEKTKQEGVRLVGYDLLEQNQEYLKKGTINFLISQQPRQQGHSSVMALFNHLVMKKEVNKNQFLPIDIITNTNIDYYINH